MRIAPLADVKARLSAYLDEFSTVPGGPSMRRKGCQRRCSGAPSANERKNARPPQRQSAAVCTMDVTATVHFVGLVALTTTIA